MTERRMMLIGSIVVLAHVVLGGVVITAENDIFDDSDNNYSHGSELEYNYWVEDGIHISRIGYGINQLMYTPKDISCSDMPPEDSRPWSGTLSLYRETWEFETGKEIRTRIGVGILGPDARAEDSQKKVHEWLGCQEPMGWDNQMPDELMLNIYQDRYRLLWGQEMNDSRIADIKWLYGGCFGTTFINAKTGVFARIGYNIPESSLPGGIVMKGDRGFEEKVFLYLIGGVDGMFVLHNATIGNSFFRDREEGQERDLENFVGEMSYGLVGGYNKLSLSYIYTQRTSEWEAEKDSDMGYGMIRLEFVEQF